MSRIADHAYGGELAPYPASPGYKEPTTSRAAARAASSRSDEVRERVYAAILAAGPDGLTADEAAARIGESILSVRPRMTELGPLHARRVEKTGARRRNESGCSASVWRAS